MSAPGPAPTQAGFAAAVLDPRRPAPAGLRTWNGSDPAQRFAVYRNNVAVSLVDALAARFPVCRQLVGETFFRAMARAHAAATPPDGPLLFRYGERFADFIDGFAPAASLPYLGDVARLEAARTRALHASEAVPVGADGFAAVPAAGLADLRVALHPSVVVVRSCWPIVAIWAAHHGQGTLNGIDLSVAEDALVARPGHEAEVHLLPPGAAVFLTALAVGRPLGSAAAEAAAAEPTFDLTRNIAGLITCRLAAALVCREEPK